MRAINHRAIATLLIGLVTPFLQGCFGWQRTSHSTVYHGRVLEMETKLPVSRAKLELDAGGLVATSKSDANGYFHVGPLRCFRVGFVVPPEPHVRPECDHLLPPEIFLNVSAPAHGTAEVLVPRNTTNGSRGVEVGDLFLKAR